MAIQKIVLGGGCFWCTEAVFQRLRGVERVTSGYAGGQIDNPSYKEICTGKTGHAEVIKIDFDDQIIRLETILEVFFETHDPTSLNKQGGDAGTQYRSVIFFENAEQKQFFEDYIQGIQKYFDKKIVTTLEPLSEFYEAEEYHQNYYNENSGQGYCSIVISPKIKKVTEKYSQLLK